MTTCAQGIEPWSNTHEIANNGHVLIWYYAHKSKITFTRAQRYRIDTFETKALIRDDMEWNMHNLVYYTLDTFMRK